jgi:hypothetical protein
MPQIIVRASPDEFSFSSDGGSLRVAPIVWYDREGMADFGEAREFNSQMRRLDLFPCIRPYGFVEPFFAPLMKFLGFHYEVVGRRKDSATWRYMFPLSPDVLFEEIRGFEASVDGDPQALLMRASQAAGARRTDFGSWAR